MRRLSVAFYQLKQEFPDGRMYEEIDAAVLSRVRSKFGGAGKVRGWQDIFVGSKGGYAAVRPKVNTYETPPGSKERYAVSYITNAIENGHRQGKGRYVPSLGSGREWGVNMLELSTLPEAVRGLLGERFPEDPCYLDVTPDGFERPSFLVESGPVEMMDASAECVEITATLKITCFAAVDSYRNSQTAELSRRLMAVLELLAVGSLAVGDRRLHIIKNTGKCELDYAEINVTLSYQDDRPGREDWPLMGEMHTKITGGIADGTA